MRCCWGLKLATHIASALLVGNAFYPDGCGSPEATLALLASLYLSQVGLDTFGHSWVSVGGRRFPRRNRLHSLPGVLAWGLLWGLALAPMCPLMALAPVAGALVHWVEDLVTEGGVYLGLSGGRLRLPRWLPRIDYDDPAANKLAIIIALAASSPWLFPSFSGGDTWRLLYSAASLAYAVRAFLRV